MPELPAINVLSRSKKAAARSGAIHLEDDRVPLTSAAADRGAAEAAATTPKLVHQGADDAGAGGADRMAEGDRAAVHVDLVVIDPQHAHRVDRHRGERFVDLPEIDVLRT